MKKIGKAHPVCLCLNTLLKSLQFTSNFLTVSCLLVLLGRGLSGLVGYMPCRVRLVAVPTYRPKVSIPYELELCNHIHEFWATSGILVRLGELFAQIVLWNFVKLFYSVGATLLLVTPLWWIVSNCTDWRIEIKYLALRRSRAHICEHVRLSISNGWCIFGNATYKRLSWILASSLVWQLNFQFGKETFTDIR